MKNSIEGVGTTNNLNDIHLIIANNLFGGDTPIGGMAVASFGFDASETNYFFNIFLDASHLGEWSGGTIAHELGHVLTNAGHTIVLDIDNNIS